MKDPNFMRKKPVRTFTKTFKKKFNKKKFIKLHTGSEQTPTQLKKPDFRQAKSMISPQSEVPQSGQRRRGLLRNSRVTMFRPKIKETIGSALPLLKKGAKMVKDNPEAAAKAAIFMVPGGGPALAGYEAIKRYRANKAWKQVKRHSMKLRHKRAPQASMRQVLSGEYDVKMFRLKENMGKPGALKKLAQKQGTGIRQLPNVAHTPTPLMAPTKGKALYAYGRRGKMVREAALAEMRAAGPLPQGPKLMPGLRAAKRPLMPAKVRRPRIGNLVPTPLSGKTQRVGGGLKYEDLKSSKLKGMENAATSRAGLKEMCAKHGKWYGKKGKKVIEAAFKGAQTVNPVSETWKKAGREMALNPSKYIRKGVS